MRIKSIVRRTVLPVVNRQEVQLLPNLSEEVDKPFTPVPGQAGYGQFFWDIRRDGVTQSLLSTFQQCPRKAELKYRRGLHSAGYDDKLDFGNQFHAILDTIYSQRKQAKPFSRAGVGKSSVDTWELLMQKGLTEYYNKNYSKIDTGDLKKFEVSFGLCELVLAHYFNWWASEDTKARIVAVEQMFSVPYKLRNGQSIVLRGKIDRIDMTPNGDYWLFETKTKSAIENTGRYSCGAILEKMSYDLQVMFYCLAIKQVYGKYPKGVIYNLVKRPGQIYKGTFNRKDESIKQFIERVNADITEKSSKTERKHEYFLRYEFSLVEKDIQEWLTRDFDYDIETLYDWCVWNRASPRRSSACSVFNHRPCEYLDICGNNDESRFSIREHIFPELAIEEEE